MAEFKHLKVTQDGEQVLVIRFPSTNATITVDATGITPHGAFRNMNSDEREEFRAAWKLAYDTDTRIQAARADVKKQLAAAHEPVAKVVTETVTAAQPKKKNDGEPTKE